MTAKRTKSARHGQRQKTNIAGAVLAASLAVSAASHGGVNHDPALNWQTLKTAHFRIHFHDGLQPAAEQAGALAEYIHERLSGRFDWQPAARTDIVLTDEVDFANGFTTPLPSNRIELWVNPPDNGLPDYSTWLETLILHEYVHVLHLDMVQGAPAALRSVFGRHALLFPGLWQPDWVTEGLATYLETDPARGIGRGQSSYFEMLMRMEVAVGVKPISQVNQPIATWPAGVTPYLYGVEFMKFIAERHGEDQLWNWIAAYRDNLIPFMINTNSRATLGEKLTPLWEEFTQSLAQHHRARLADIAQRGLREGERITDHGYYTGRSKVLADGTLYYVRADGRSAPWLMRRERGAREATALVELQGDARFDVHPQAGIVIAQPERYRNARTYYDLYHFDPATKRMRRLTKAGRYRFAAWNADGSALAAVRTEAGVYSVDLLSAKGDRRETLWRGTDEQVVSGIEWSPTQATLMASMWEREQGWNLAEFSLDTRQWRRLTNDTAIESDPRYSADGQAIVYSADYDGVYNIYRLERSTGRVQTWTNVRGGAFSPAIDVRGDLYYTGYGPAGYDIFHLPPNDAALPAPAQTAGTSAVYQSRVAQARAAKVTAYDSTAGLAPMWWTPVLAIGDDLTLLGASTSGSDPLHRHNYGLTAAYDFANDWLVGAIDYTYDGWYPLLNLNMSRDLTVYHAADDTLARIETDDYFRAALTWPFLNWRARWAAHAGVSAEVERDVERASWLAKLPDRRDEVVGLAATYDSTQRHALSISRSNGRQLEFIAEDSDVLPSDYQGNVYTFDWREFVALGSEHVLALRYLEGWGDEGSRPFQLGGVFAEQDSYGGSTSVVPPPFNRRDYALRGYGDDLFELAGNRVRTISAEWRMPLYRLERGTMAPPLGIDYWSAALFVDSGAAAAAGDSPGDYFTGVGIELDTRLQLFYQFSLDAVLGYAQGLDDELGEAQWYLRLGTSF